MISNEYGRIILQCDGCEEEHIFYEFEEVLDFLDTEEWQKKKVNRYDWEHYCPDCTEKWFKKKGRYV